MQLAGLLLWPARFRARIKAAGRRTATVAAAVGVLAATVSAQVSNIGRGTALEMLKQVKEDLKKHYYDPSFHGIDLDARFAAADAKVRQAANATELTTVLADLLAEFKDSHTRFHMPPRSVRVEYGWWMTMVGDAPLITQVDKGSDAERKGLQRGDHVLWLNRYEPTRENLRWLRYYYRAVRTQEVQRLTVRKPDGTERTFDIQSKVSEQSVVQMDDWIGDLIESSESYQTGRDALEPVGRDVLIWRMTGFGDVRRVEQAIRRARDYKGLVIDMRGNGGGLVDTERKLVELTFDRPVTIVTEKRRNGTVTTTAKPAKSPFAGTIVAVVDSESSSAAEIYARLLQIEKRGTVVGDRTAGAVMTALVFPHTAGAGMVTFYATSITVGDVRMSDGSSLERIGVTPDELVLPTGADLAADRDPALARAVALAGGTLTPEQAGKLSRK